MRVLAAALAVAMSVALLGWMGLRDPKRMHAQHRDGIARAPLDSRQRRWLALGAVMPGFALMLSGWWSSAVLWLGATVTLLWLWVLWLARPAKSLASREQ